METTVTTIKANLLIFDYGIYPRHKVDPYHVRAMMETLRTGTPLPPSLVDEKTLRVVDGVHRVTAYRKHEGTEAGVPCVLKTWPDEASMLLEAIRLNATHGRSLTTYDKARCIGLAEGLKIGDAQIALALSMTVTKLGEIKSTRLATYQGEQTALKCTTEHLHGSQLDNGEARYNIKAGGLNQTFYINQVIAMLEHNTVDWSNENAVKALKRLHELLATVLETRVEVPVS